MNESKLISICIPCYEMGGMGKFFLNENLKKIENQTYKNNQPFTITNDGEQRRDFTYVKDVVLANILASEYDGNLNSEIFNVGNGKSSLYKFCKKM